MGFILEKVIISQLNLLTFDLPLKHICTKFSEPLLILHAADSWLLVAWWGKSVGPSQPHGLASYSCTCMYYDAASSIHVREYGHTGTDEFLIMCSSMRIQTVCWVASDRNPTSLLSRHVRPRHCKYEWEERHVTASWLHGEMWEALEIKWRGAA